MFINKHTMRLNNERSVIRHVINYGPISRSKISRDLSINKVTISSILEDLLSQQYVVEIGEGESTKNGGRKPKLIEFNKNFGYFINIEIGKNYINIMSTWANGQIARFEEISTIDKSDQQIYQIINKKITNFALKHTVHSLLGISLAVHHRVFNNISQKPILKDIDLPKALEKNFEVPVILLNSANAAAIFQRDFSSNNEIKNLISLTINETIDAGIIIDENLYLGNQAAAGNIAEMKFLLSTDNKIVQINPIKYCSQDAILKEVYKDKGLSNLSLQQLSKLYVQGNPRVVASIKQFIEGLSLVLNNLIASYAPQIVFLDSTLIENLPLLLIQLRNNLPILQNTGTKLEISRQSTFAPLLGSYSFLMRQIFHLGTKRLRLIP
ncbi:ROK family protein [Lactobacillus johnsonii]|uniref:ROK family protein n=1 Tax=Lactobacillus johnsonii TaxID=33959 RepID=UPI0028E39AB8|nr:ROK family protein [Lactobacillus johnsonii]MDT9604982.1 ROK family protein [Lactobacillus johnsonii]